MPSSSFTSSTSTSTNHPLTDRDPPLWAQIQLVQQVTTTTSTTTSPSNPHQPIRLRSPTAFKTTPKSPSTSPSTSAFAPNKRAMGTGEEEDDDDKLGGEIGILKERAMYVSRVKPRGGVGWAEFGGGEGVGVGLLREMGGEGRDEVQHGNERLVVRGGRETSTAIATTTATLVVRRRVSLDVDVDAGDNTAMEKESN